ncbi:hypothetical protein F4780DRAFT_87556 [Xylariomycetidae sp. FL0641]|nr:hypothetical protein F4780DRAFT_87556 [Xylariomycetidae sp. FL0641]
MAQDGRSQLTACCFLVSFLCLTHAWQQSYLIDQPHLSACLILLISAAGAGVASFFTVWLPGGTESRFDADVTPKGSAALIPHRPRRFYVPCIIILVILRIEILNTVIRDFQCSNAGIEAYLSGLLALYSFVTYRAAHVDIDEPEDMWGNPLNDLKTWLTSSPITPLFGSLLLSTTTYSMVAATQPSTYFCSTIFDRGSLVVFLQWTGLCMDATVLILAWKVLSWIRTTKGRLRTLGGILIVASLAESILWVAHRLAQWRGTAESQILRGIGSAYLLDLLSKGLITSILIVSASLVICETSPLELTTVATFTCGTLASVQKVVSVGSFPQLSALQPSAGLVVTSFSFAVFLYANSIRTVLFIHRALLLFVLVCVSAGLITYGMLQPGSLKRSPVDELVYKSRVEADRWLRHATVSSSLKIAVDEYKDRHHGRDPPQNFDKWFDFALQRGSLVIDRFDQMEEDMLPFWGMEPEHIRNGFDFLKERPDIGVLDIANGQVRHHGSSDASQNVVLDEAVSMISNFVQYLPEMSIAINLGQRPKVMAPWDDIQTYKSRTGTSSPPTFFGPSRKRGVVEPSVPDSDDRDQARRSTAQPYISATSFRQLQGLSCPHGSAVRDGAQWNVRDFCTACPKPQSREQFLSDWEKSLDPCHQPDAFYLHDFYTVPHRAELYQGLLPLFSRSKTDSFSDILIPLVRPEASSAFDLRSFPQKQNSIFWQDDIANQPPPTHHSLHGGHRHRLLHLVNNGSNTETVTMLLGVGSEETSRFQYEVVNTEEANAALPFHVSLTNTAGGCNDASCQLVQREFGLQPRSDVLDHRFVMLLDSADGPPPSLLSILRSNSVPVLSSIFREWYTERLMAWVHFIPIDLRYHALHSTLSYFVGLKGHKLNGRDQLTEARSEDSKWIASQGRKWAEQAIRREDMEIYLFRLLLEWGRVIHDDRETMGFVFQG